MADLAHRAAGLLRRRQSKVRARARAGATGARQDRQTAASRLILLVGLGLIVLTITIAGVAMWELRQQTEDAYRRQINSLGIVLSEQTARYVNAIDLALHDVPTHVAALGVRTPEQYRQWLQSAEAHDYMAGHLRNMAQVDSFDGIDAHGQLLESTHRYPFAGVDVSDRDYFRATASGASGDLFIGAPVTGRVDKAPIIVVACRINAPNGDFLGLAVAAINVEYLLGFYRAANTQPGQSITLLRRDGRILVRYPDPTNESGRQMPQGSPWYDLIANGGGFYRSPGFLGGQRALVTVHPLGSYPLIVDVSLKEDVALTAWWHQVMMLALAGLTASLGFGLLSWKITALFRRQEQQNTALQHTATALHDTQARVAQESHLLQTTLEAMDQGLMMISRERTVPICNRRAMELLDLPPDLMTRCPSWEEVLAHQWQADEFTRTDATFQDYIRRTLLLDGPPIYDRERPNGRVLEVRTTPLSDGEAVRTYTDITERKRAERRIEFLAYHDNLTGLANRTLLHDRLSQAVEYAKRGDASLAVLSLDLDRFKVINDTYGHDAGDQVLRDIGDRLKRVVRAADTIARVGGDEFIILQTGTAQPAAAVELAHRIEEALTQPVRLAGHQVTISASIGIALYPADGDTVAALLKAADIALYRAKADGRGLIRLFEPEMDRVLTERRLIERDLQAAIGTEQLSVHFQPQFACGTGDVTGFEALVRWRHEGRGDISPGLFIPVAEESRLIIELSAWVLETACATAASWPVPHRISVNLSPAQFRDNNLPAEVAAVLRRTGLPAERLELEVTESVLIRHTEQALDTLRALKRMGVRISLDDFGTGYSSLSYLRSFPFDKIKIDKSFVQALGTDPNALPIVQAILAMGRSLNLEVIAEGVETELQLWLLRGQHCAQVQGFLLGLPIPASQVQRHLEPEGPDWPRERPAEDVARA